jgi:hypothetical protein
MLPYPSYYYSLSSFPPLKSRADDKAIQRARMRNHRNKAQKRKRAEP